MSKKSNSFCFFQSRASVHYFTNRSDHGDLSNLFLKAEGWPLQTDSSRQNCFVLGGPKGDAHLSLYHHLNTFKDLQRQGSLYEFGDASVAIRFTDQTVLVDLASPCQPTDLKRTESCVYLSVFDCLAKFLNEKFAAFWCGTKGGSASKHKPKVSWRSALSELPLSHCLEDIVGSILTFELKLSPFNFSTKYQSFTISGFFKSHQRPPLPLLENHGGDDMPSGSALKRSPLGLNSRDLNQSGRSGDSIVEGERATTARLFSLRDLTDTIWTAVSSGFDFGCGSRFKPVLVFLEKSKCRESCLSPLRMSSGGRGRLSGQMRSPVVEGQTWENVKETCSTPSSVKALLRECGGVGVTFLIPTRSQRPWSPPLGFQCVYDDEPFLEWRVLYFGSVDGDGGGDRYFNERADS
uniref:Uncharacterized protein n=1 Tax=Brassica oleracea var. oleracea TaxID=109376 RepID=A0A0D2ZRR4_BRAOL